MKEIIECPQCEGEITAQHIMISRILFIQMSTLQGEVKRNENHTVLNISSNLYHSTVYYN